MSKARQLADLGNVYDDGALSNRNKLINGAMVIDQRNGGSSVAIGSGNTYGVDRWKGQGSGGGAWTAQQSTNAPSGFTNSTLLTVTTADASIAASDYYIWGQAVEGFNAADLGFGSSGAKSVTLSFWVRSSVTGNYALFLDNSGDNRTYVTEYTINSADTWEYKTITISGDTAGSWLTNNGIGIALWFTFGAGSNFNATADQWNASLEMNTSGSTQWISTLGATFYITGVQLEVGDTATPFEHRSYGDELARCQRYYYQPQYRNGVGGFETASRVAFITRNPVEMRATPTITRLATTSVGTINGVFSDGGSFAFADGSTLAIVVSFGVSTTQAVGLPVTLGGSNTIAVDAEL
jgi:hypothetical protein